MPFTADHPKAEPFLCLISISDLASTRYPTKHHAMPEEHIPLPLLCPQVEALLSLTRVA
jgi:hypothetical protein